MVDQLGPWFTAFQKACTLTERENICDQLKFASCHYYHNGDICGPIGLYQIFEAIDAGDLPIEVQVIMEGSDYWRQAWAL